MTIFQLVTIGTAGPVGLIFALRVVFTIFGKNNFNLREAFFFCLAVIAFLIAFVGVK